MTIIIQEASDADIPHACHMEAAAYAPVDMSVFFPGPFPSTGWTGRADQIIAMRKADPTAHLLKAVDEGTGEQIAFAKWHIYKTPEAVASAPTRPVPAGPGVNAAACKAFFGGLVHRKQAIMGTKPHLYLHMLHTDPKHQRHGAASALLRWGTQNADDLGLPVYLESSSEAHVLYGRHGFKDVEIFEVPLQEFGGGDKTHRAPLMIREPVKRSD